MTRMLSRILLVIGGALMLGAPAWAQVGGAIGSGDSAPDNALKAFWQSVADKDYPTSWRLLSQRSQQEIAGTIANAEKRPIGEIVDLFERNDRSIVGGFWTSFRESSKAEIIASQAKYRAQPAQGDRCGVITIINNHESRPVLMFREGGQWRVGFAETFLTKQPPTDSKEKIPR